VIAHHGRYSDVAGWFSINNQAAAPQSNAAKQLCGVGSANGIACAVVAQPGKHDWPYAAHAFAAALPWLAGQLRTPGIPAVPLPTRPSPPSIVQAAAR
jgi:S-formylglutathione hydrolase FrmB